MTGRKQIAKHFRKHFSSAALALALAGSAAGGLGCGAAPRRGETLQESVRTYHEGIRWQRYTAAAGRLPPAERSAFLDEWDERSADLKVTDYEIVDMETRGDTARVQVKFSWYGEREGTLHDTHARQTWNRRGKVWILTDEVRTRGEPMPGLAEPAEGTEGSEGSDGEGGEAAEGRDRGAGEVGTAAAPTEPPADLPVVAPAASASREKNAEAPSAPRAAGPDPRLSAAQ